MRNFWGKAVRYNMTSRLALIEDVPCVEMHSAGSEPCRKVCTDFH